MAESVPAVRHTDLAVPEGQALAVMEQQNAELAKVEQRGAVEVMPGQTAGDMMPMPEQKVDVQSLFDSIATGLGETDDTDRLPLTLKKKLGEFAMTPLLTVAVDQSDDATAKAWEQANRQHTEELNDPTLGWARRLIRNIWKGNIAKPAERLKLKNEAYDEILREQNIYQFDGDEAQADRANTATRARFGEVRTNEVIHEGEHREEHEDDEYAVEVRGLITKYLNDELDDEQFEEAKKEFFAEYYARHAGEEGVGEGAVINDDLLNTAKAARARLEVMMEAAEALNGVYEHVASVENVVNNIRIVSGKARSGVRTEVRYGKLEGAVDKLSQNKFLQWVSPETIALAASAAIVVGRSVTTKSLNTLTAGVGVAAGAFGYVRESKNIMDERSQHDREMAMGESFEPDAKRREEMESFRYETKDATELAASLHQTTGEELETGGKEALEAALKALADVQMRVVTSDMGNIDLISYSGRTNVEEERYNLDIARAHARVVLERRLANGGAELLGRPGENLEQILDEHTAAVQQEIKADRTAKDEAFTKMRRRRAAGAGVKAVAFGVAIGAIAQEASAALPGSHAAGLFSGPAKDGQHETILRSAYDKAQELIGTSNANTHFTPFNYAGHATMQLNDGYSILPGNGSVGVLDGSGKVIPGLDALHVDAQGHLAPDALTALKDHGFSVKDLGPTGPAPAAAPVSIDQYATQHSGEFQHFNVSYEDNGTAAYDLNEQGGRLSMNPDGSVSIGQAMTAGGSFNAEGAIDMTQGQNYLDMSFTQSDGSTIHKTFAYGQPIAKPWADMLYQHPDGTWGFKGNGEVHWGKMAGGTFYSAASLPGDGQPITLPGEAQPAFANYQIAGGPHTVTDLPPIMPLVPRKPLENTRDTEHEPTPEPLVPVPPTPLTPPVIPIPQPAIEPAPERQAIEQAPDKKAIEQKLPQPELVQGKPNELVRAEERPLEVVEPRDERRTTWVNAERVVGPEIESKQDSRELKRQQQQAIEGKKVLAGKPAQLAIEGRKRALERGGEEQARTQTFGLMRRVRGVMEAHERTAGAGSTLRNIQGELTAILNDPSTNEARFRLSLAFILPPSSVRGENGEMTRRLRYTITVGTDGKKVLKLTKSGKALLLKHIRQGIWANSV